jgi:hypothetical protein
MTYERVKVLYIGGYGRSGSTLLVRLLGQLRGFQAVGELWNVWQRSFTDNELCGCGKPFKECEFWGAVVEEAFGGFSAVPLDDIRTMRGALRSQAYLLPLLYPQVRTAEQQRLIQDYATILGKLYRGIHAASGGKVIVDSSKGPRYAMLLREVPDMDLRVVHLVRDSRAVVYSWQKKMIKPEVYWKATYMDRPNPVGAALNWNVTNLLTHSLHNNGADYVFARYEDLIASPRTDLARMARFAGEELDESALFGQADAANLAVDHTAVGNPNRFRQGQIELRHDDEWRHKMPRSQKVLVTMLTLPLLRKYGYLVPVIAGATNSNH